MKFHYQNSKPKCNKMEGKSSFSIIVIIEENVIISAAVVLLGNPAVIQSNSACAWFGLSIELLSSPHDQMYVGQGGHAHGVKKIVSRVFSSVMNCNWKL